jgi:hypothetical protein
VVRAGFLASDEGLLAGFLRGVGTSKLRSGSKA